MRHKLQTTNSRREFKTKAVSTQEITRVDSIWNNGEHERMKDIQPGNKQSTPFHNCQTVSKYCPDSGFDRNNPTNRLYPILIESKIQSFYLISSSHLCQKPLNNFILFSSR